MPNLQKPGYNKYTCPTCGTKNKDAKPVAADAAIPAALQCVVMPAGYHFMGATLPTTLSTHPPKRSYEFPSALQISGAILGILGVVISISLIFYSLHDVMKPNTDIPVISRSYGTIGAMRAKNALSTSLNGNLLYLR